LKPIFSAGDEYGQTHVVM